MECQIAGVLKRFVLENGLSSEAAFRASVLGPDPGEPGTSPLTVLRAGNIPDLDHDGIVRRKRFSATRQVFDVPYLKIRDSSEVAIVDCVFMGDLRIDLFRTTGAIVNLDTCIVLGKLVISGVEDEVGTLGLTEIRAGSLFIDRLNTTGLSLSSCGFAETSLFSLTGPTLRCYGSELGAFRAKELSFVVHDFPAGQVDLDASVEIPEWREEAVGTPLTPLTRGGQIFDPFAYRAPDWDGFAKQLSAHEKELVRQSTIQFLRANTGERFNRARIAALRYAQAKSESNGAGRWFVVMTGGFIRPWVFALWSAAVVGLGAFGFMWGDAVTCVAGAIAPCNLSLPDALMLSGVTFTTIGYGTPTPVGWHQAWAVLEGALGITLSSSFVVSLTRRYIE